MERKKSEFFYPTKNVNTALLQNCQSTLTLLERKLIFSSITAWSCGDFHPPEVRFFNFYAYRMQRIPPNKANLKLFEGDETGQSEKRQIYYSIEEGISSFVACWVLLDKTTIWTVKLPHLARIYGFHPVEF